VILCSALSQQPLLKFEQKGGQHFYRLHDVAGCLTMLGTTPVKVEPVMTHQYLVHFGSEKATATARERLAAITLDGKAVCDVRQEPGESVTFGCQLSTSLSGEELLQGVWSRNQPAGRVLAHHRDHIWTPACSRS
jgi:hypothetical protein